MARGAGASREGAVLKQLSYVRFSNGLGDKDAMASLVWGSPGGHQGRYHRRRRLANIVAALARWLSELCENGESDREFRFSTIAAQLMDPTASSSRTGVHGLVPVACLLARRALGRWSIVESQPGPACGGASRRIRRVTHTRSRWPARACR